MHRSIWIRTATNCPNCPSSWRDVLHKAAARWGKGEGGLSPSESSSETAIGGWGRHGRDRSANLKAHPSQPSGPCPDSPTDVGRRAAGRRALPIQRGGPSDGLCCGRARRPARRPLPRPLGSAHGRAEPDGLAPIRQGGPSDGDRATISPRPTGQRGHDRRWRALPTRRGIRRCASAHHFPPRQDRWRTRKADGGRARPMADAQGRRRLKSARPGGRRCRPFLDRRDRKPVPGRRPLTRGAYHGAQCSRQGLFPAVLFVQAPGRRPRRPPGTGRLPWSTVT